MDDLERQHIEALRAWADENNTFCVFATLTELSALLGHTAIPTPEQALKEYETRFGQGRSGAVSPQDFFSVVETFASPLGISIAQVIADPSFIDKFNVPSEIQPKLRVVTGMQQVDYPNMRVLAKEKQRGNWITHAESDDGNERLKARIEPMLKRGWQTGMVVNFEQSDR